ncbi:uncharacterized protein LOC131251304 isoform X2 [Magnolia sinica]|uniref:uncharacterized protein LOC131251304 isoform X2 n=1 Tax=Magnolia sinica TaxID=86752 RepID=UPI002658078E|nr:uncharacterized protein LOC131251304 isoform X2 [Magnolia sinica]
MRDSQSGSSETDLASNTTGEEDGQLSQSNNESNTSLGRIPEPSRHWRDVFWLCIFAIHLVGLGFVLAVLGINRFKKADRLKIDKYTNKIIENQAGLTETYWPFYAVAGGVGTVLGWAWLLLLGTRASQMMKVSVYGLTTCLAVMSVLCFWGGQIFWGIAFAIGAFLQFLYVMSVMDRFPFTMLVLQKAVNMVWNLPEVTRIAIAFMVVMLLWMVIWSFGVAGVVASSIGDGGRWWLLVVLSVSLFWTGAVLCNTVHVIVSGMVFLVLIHGGRGAASMPQKPVVKSLQHAVTTSLGSICYGSLFTAAIRTLRWEIRGVRSKIGNNECLLCCVDFLFNLVETLVRFFNKYAYVQVGLAMVVVESAVTSIYICYAEDPSLINRWDPEFFNQMSEALHQRLQHRSARRQVINHRLDAQIQAALPL